jgi:ABC-type glycerol-3-phosphate transport system substrate-binding protein
LRGQFDAHIRTGNIDVFRADRGGLQYVRENMLKPLDDVQLGDWAGIRDDYFKGTWEGLSIQGQQWGIPAGLDMMVMYVNLDQAQALHVALPTANGPDDPERAGYQMNYLMGCPTRLATSCSLCTI